MKQIITAVKVFAAMAILTGIVYPLLITAVSQLAFNKQANGSLVIVDGQIKGSELIAQKFDQDKYFWARPSAFDYNTLSSGGSNLSATSRQLRGQIKEREKTILKVDPTKQAKDIPSDLLYSSGSGLDPHISISAALFQIDRILRSRKLDFSRKADMIELINMVTRDRDFKLLGERRINVLKLNILLDREFDK